MPEAVVVPTDVVVVDELAKTMPPETKSLCVSMPPVEDGVWTLVVIVLGLLSEQLDRKRKRQRVSCQRPEKP